MADTETDEEYERRQRLLGGGFPDIPGLHTDQPGQSTQMEFDDKGGLPPVVRNDPRDLSDAENEPDTAAIDEAERRLVESGKYGPPDPRGRADVSGAIGDTDVMAGFRRGQERMHEIGERAQAELEPLYDRAIAATNERRPDPPPLQHAPFPVDRTFDMSQYLVPAMMVSVFGSLISRQHMTGALNSFAGYMEGARQGNLDQAKIKLEDWKAQSQAVVDENNVMMKQYEAILKAKNMDDAQKWNAVRLTAQKWQDQMRIQQAENKSWTDMARSLEALRYHNAQLDAKNRQIDIQQQRLNATADAASGHEMTAASKEIFADMFMETGRLPPNIFRGKKARDDAIEIMNRVAEKAAAEGLTGTDLAARLKKFTAETAVLTGAARTAGAQAAKIGAAIDETDATIPYAKEEMAALSKRINLGNIRATNAAKLWKAHETGVPEYRTAYDANEAVITSYGAVMGRGNAQLTNLARTRADALLQIVEGPTVYEAGLKQLQKEMGAAKTAPLSAIKKLLEESVRKKSDVTPGGGTEDDAIKDKVKKSLGLP